ncbi:hypothetical protein NCS57_00356300 [Fusarium keratoplasticum]|uniref:Uncharacterized protein n=1 Tax=Fusarium keratoplasticum TaxID=1328300 RepID=A0ACC0R5R6_9HYPO|nr:hypothetical protein NCS57_00356300 [Fusarium keratoplasticum]KAI8674581.1 hypothetical protein NCS57_00356300 [Fusarium keratoplasticum]
MSGSRSKTGCWTCRLRRKKCDENKPACENCTSRNLECYGYDQKPAWMLGKESWQHVLNSDEARAIKDAAEKAYSRRRQKNLHTAPWSAGVIVQHVKELGHPVQSTTILDRTWSNCTQTLRDCDYAPNYQHVQTFLDVIFPLQWGFFALCKQPDRRWLFDTIIASEPMYHASSGLCISFETGVKAGFTNGTCHITPEVRKSRLLALQGLQPCIAELQEQKPQNSSLLKAVHAVAIMLLLSSLEIYGETEGTWEVHLNAAGTALDLVERQLATPDNASAIGELLSNSTLSFETRALGLFVATYAWTDILAEAVHGTSYTLHMSGAEAVAVFALACNVMQVVEAACKTVGTCKRIYQTGQPDPALDEYGSQLRDISDALETQLNKTVGPLSPDDTRLRDLAVRCTTIANGLVDQIASVSKSAGKRTIGSSILLAIKNRFNQSYLSRWEKDLAKAQSAMETQLLVGLRQRVDANMLQNDEMDRDLKYFISQLADNQTSLSDLIIRQKREIKEEISKGLTEVEASTKAHITAELHHNESRMQSHVSKAFSTVEETFERHAQEDSCSRSQEEAYRRLLNSLKFSEMEARRNHVSHACPKTFRWILDSQDSSSDDEYDGTEDYWEDTDGDDDNDDDEGSHSTGSIDSDISMPSNSPDSPTWDSLIDWLQSSEPVYWISGKPASGKSTLMKFILSHDQTKPLLNQWQDNVRILSHFFWRPGTELQQSIKGLLCSLLHQIFVQDKDQALIYLETRRELSWKDSSSDWDPKELEALLLEYLQRPLVAICLFIDGLDEVWPKDGVQNLISLLKTLLQKSNRLKLCVSSRREHLLESRLCDYPQLKMHELIHNDLEKYAIQALSEASAHANLDSGDIRTIINQIVWASDGVFLWVVLVSNSLSRGLQNGDSCEELFQRLDSLPRDLEGLYLDMWLRQNGDDEFYRKSSAKLLYLCLVGLGWKEKPEFGLTPTVLQLMVAMDDEGPEDHLIHRRYPVEELRIRCQTTVKMIQVRSAGLLEVYDVYDMSQHDPNYEAIFDDRANFLGKPWDDL